MKDEKNETQIFTNYVIKFLLGSMYILVCVVFMSLSFNNLSVRVRTGSSQYLNFAFIAIDFFYAMDRGVKRLFLLKK